MKRNEQGFGAVEILLIIIIIALAGVSGWYVYKHRTHAAAPAKTVQTSAKTEKKPAAQKDETADWYVYASPDKNYSIKLPDGWKLVSYQGDSSPYTMHSEDIAYTPGQRATVTSTSFAGDVNQVAFAMGASWRSDVRGDKATSFKTDQGLDVTRYDYVVPHQEIQDIAAGTTEFLYAVTGGKTTFQVVHDVAPGAKDSNNLIVKALKTLVIN